MSRSKAETFIAELDRERARIAEACTRCGKCVDACPTPALTGIDDIAPELVAGGVVDILNGAPHAAPSETWARACCGTAACIDACPEAINPRVMLALARRALNQRNAPEARRADGRRLFQAMSRSVRALSRLQLPPDVLARLNPPVNRSPAAAPPDLIFYTGCNLLRTPHIGLLCLDVFDKLGVRYEVQGGPGNCCGILQYRPGDTENAGRQAMTTIERFRATGTGEVVAWCPTCHIQFTELALPAAAGDGAPVFDMNMLPVYLARRLDDLKPLMTERVEKRVALFEFPGARGVTEAVQALLDAVPGVERVDLGLQRAGYQMSALDTLPDYRREVLAQTFRAAEAAGVDVLLSVFHADHRELAAHDPEWPFEILNYMDIVGAGMGLARDDLFKRLRAMGEVDAIVAAAAETIAANGLDLDEARDIVAATIGEQHLPSDRSAHPDVGG